MTSPVPYWELDVMNGLYLEDSYVLGIHERDGRLVFTMEFVLREQHPNYRPPNHGQQYCYRRGELIFEPASEIEWLERHDVASVDATGETDLGNIDSMNSRDGVYQLEGEWGHVRIRSPQPTVELLTENSA